MNRDKKIEAVATWISEHGRTPDNELEDTDALAENIINDLFPESLPKYVILAEWETHKDQLLERINAHVDQGYRVHSFNTDYSESEYKGMGETRYNVLLSLSSAKYRGITNIEDVSTEDANELLEHDWEILETFSKKIRMVLRE